MTRRTEQCRRLRALREASGLSQKEVNHLLGRKLQYLTQVENGYNILTLGTAMQLADIYKVTVDQLLGRAPITITIHSDTTR